MISRVPSLLEQAIKSKAGGTNPEVRNQLDVYSKTETNQAIASIDISSSLAAISGSLHNEIVALETQTNNNFSYVWNDLSGANTDITNLDVSLTNKITTDCVQSAGTSGAGTTLYGALTITINGVTYKVALVS